MRRRSTVETTPKPLTAAKVRSVARALEKRLCADQAAGEAFAAFIARQALAQLESRKRSDTVSAERWAQSEHKNIPYGAVRLVVCWEAMQVETALNAVLARWPEERARYGYELASDFVKRYEPGAFGDLNRASAEPLAEVITFWHGYADSLAAAVGEADAQRLRAGGQPKQAMGGA